MFLDETLVSATPIKRLRELIKLDGVCIYCGLDFHPDDLTCDHIIPRSLGGSTSHWNLVCACPKCNRSKSSRNVWEFWIHSGQFDDALTEGRVEQLIKTLCDRRNLAEYLSERLSENPSYSLNSKQRITL